MVSYPYPVKKKKISTVKEKRKRGKVIKSKR